MLITIIIHPFLNKPWFFTCLLYKSFENSLGKGEISPFPTVFTTLLKNFLPFSSNLKFPSANSFSLEVSKVCHVRKGLTMTSLVSSKIRKTPPTFLEHGSNSDRENGLLSRYEMSSNSHREKVKYPPLLSPMHIEEKNDCTQKIAVHLFIKPEDDHTADSLLVCVCLVFRKESKTFWNWTKQHLAVNRRCTNLTLYHRIPTFHNLVKEAF